MIRNVRHRLPAVIAALILAGCAGQGVTDPKCPSGLPPPEPNGCSDLGVNAINPLWDFEPACNAHDRCYDGLGMDRQSCDKTFSEALGDICSQQTADPDLPEDPSDSSISSGDALAFMMAFNERLAGKIQRTLDALALALDSGDWNGLELERKLAEIWELESDLGFLREQLAWLNNFTELFPVREQCNLAAFSYYLAVRRYGKAYFETAQSASQQRCFGEIE